MKPHRRTSQKGFALIEALVGILIFSIGVLGIVGLQATMTKAQTASKFRADAAYLANELMGVMSTDTVGNMTNYDSGACGTYARCKDWAAKLASALPGGSAAVTVVPMAEGADVDITISWTVPNEGTSRFQTSTSLRS
jgi:type IV pilus assembly protein PilV